MHPKLQSIFLLHIKATNDYIVYIPTTCLRVMKQSNHTMSSNGRGDDHIIENALLDSQDECDFVVGSHVLVSGNHHHHHHRSFIIMIPMHTIFTKIMAHAAL